MVRPEGLEPPAFWFVAKRSIQLSYGRKLLQAYYKMVRVERFELPTLPPQTECAIQAALHTDKTLVPTIRIERIWLAFQTRAMTTLAQSAKSSAFVIAAHSLSLKTSWRPSEKSKLTVSELRQ